MVGSTDDSWLSGKRVAVMGRLAGMTKQDLASTLREHGAEIVAGIGEADVLLVADDSLLDDAVETSLAASQLDVVRESQLWEHLGLVESRLYTPAMLAELLDLPLATIRRWQRRGLITPVREVRRLPYFDFQQVSWARRIAELMASGIAPSAIEKKLNRLAQRVPGVDRQMAQLNVIVEGREILMRQGEGLIDAHGQLRIDFEALDREDAEKTIAMSTDDAVDEVQLDDWGQPSDAETLLERAAMFEESGELEAATDIYHAVMALTGPTAEVCFQLAEVLYRLGRVDGATERYFIAIELDEDFVEARANLGCVLAECGRLDLAIAAFRGALDLHPEYPDVHYHLAQALDSLGDNEAAEGHWRNFLQLAPDSPWADEAEERLHS
jgi:tetratricopeptide (TPR) repeat protein